MTNTTIDNKKLTQDANPTKVRYYFDWKGRKVTKIYSKFVNENGVSIQERRYITEGEFDRVERYWTDYIDGKSCPASSIEYWFINEDGEEESAIEVTQDVNPPEVRYYTYQGRKVTEIYSEFVNENGVSIQEYYYITEGEFDRVSRYWTDYIDGKSCPASSIGYWFINEDGEKDFASYTYRTPTPTPTRT